MTAGVPLSAVTFARLLVSFPCELDRGHLRRLPPHDVGCRRQAARLARLLAPGARAAGGWVSTEVVVRLTRDPDTAIRPDVCVVLGELPVTGVTDVAPVLVVALAGPAGRPHAGTAVGRWLEAGVRAVWTVDSAGLTEHHAGSRRRALEPTSTLRVPGHPSLDLPAGAVEGLAPPRPAGSGVRTA